MQTLLKISTRTPSVSQIALSLSALFGFAFLLQIGLNWIVGRQLVFLLIPPVVVASWYFGFRMGLLIALVSAIAADFFLFYPYYAFDLSNANDLTTLAAYLVITIPAAWIFAKLAQKTRLLNLAQIELEMTLKSIGDGVLVVDRERKVQFLNPIAELLTGWSLAEARGREMKDVFRIVNQTTREPAFNPVERVLREGTIVGLANHTVLLARGGTEFAIEDSAAPILIPGEDQASGVVLVFRDVTAKHSTEIKAKNAEDSLSQNQKLLDQIFNEAPAYMVIVSYPELKFVRANNEYKKLIGRDNLIGRSVTEVLPKFEAEGLLGLVNQVASTKERFIGSEIPISIQGPDGEVKQHYFDFIYQPLVNAVGEVYAILGQGTAVTEKVLARQEIQKAREDAERANELKSAFLANMSHEIRTPLGAMLGFADLLRDPGLSNNERANFIDIMSRNGENLNVIINDILDLSKVEAGHLTLEYTDVSVEQVAAEVVSLLRVKAKEKDLVLEYNFDEETPKSIVADPTRIRQILLNLVGNAIKFTSFGSVELRGYGCKADDGADAICFEVKDTGIGVPSSQFDQIFKVFVQADNSMTRKFGGTGLGLALSRSLAREMGGDVEVVESKEGVGTTFKVTIKDQPTKRNSKADQKVVAETVQLDERPLNGLRILVVDDAPDNQQLIWRYLTKRGAFVESAENGFLGYRKALSENFDLVLMDIQMPVMDGYTATAKLREAGFRKPVIALTAHAMSEIRKKALNVGYTDHLTKPINVNELVSSILRYTAEAATEKV